MTQDAKPIVYFVAERYSTPAVQRIVDTWRIEPALVIQKLAEHFQEMGIYRVAAGHEKVLAEHMLQLLRHSPELQRMVSKAKQEDAKRQRSRHAD